MNQGTREFSTQAIETPAKRNTPSHRVLRSRSAASARRNTSAASKIAMIRSLLISTAREEGEASQRPLSSTGSQQRGCVQPSVDKKTGHTSTGQNRIDEGGLPSAAVRST